MMNSATYATSKNTSTRGLAAGAFAVAGADARTIMTVTDRYHAALASGELMPDEHQRQVVEKLQRITEQLQQQAQQPVVESRSSLSDKVFSLFRKPVEVEPELVTGLYVWGGVGRGKTHVVDLFYEALPIEQKTRIHFHRFMQLVHNELKKLKDVENTLEVVAGGFSDRFRLLCLDEMHINDITDAMLVGELFRHLFRRGVTLITTSNVPPSGLYKDGLQRDRFLPAIALLERHTEVFHIGGDTDYRLRALEQAETYLDSHAPDVGEKLEKEFNALVGVVRHADRTSIQINDRSIPVIHWDDGIAWFTFTALCDSPRSTADYIEIAEFFHTVIVQDIPQFDKDKDDAARRFVNLVDEFYDRSVNLIVSAAAAPEALYTGQRLAFEFDRTASRLREMQSKEYLHKQHLCDD